MGIGAGVARASGTSGGGSVSILGKVMAALTGVSSCKSCISSRILLLEEESAVKKARIS